MMTNAMCNDWYMEGRDQQGMSIAGYAMIQEAQHLVMEEAEGDIISEIAN